MGRRYSREIILRGYMTKTIQLTKGLLTIVDDEDYEYLIKYSWFAKKNHKKFYAQRRSGAKHYQMHDEIMTPPTGFSDDHINGDSLDNRKCNLRFASQRQQCFNRKKSSNQSSIYKGVSFHIGKQKWTAQIKKDGIISCLGTFLNEEDAALAYDKKALEFFGEYARLNFTHQQLHAMAMDLLEQEKALRAAGERLWGKFSPAKQESMF